MDKNGYNPSIMDTEPGTCFICGAHRETIRHEVFCGPNRSISKKHGFWVNICPVPWCHQDVHTHAIIMGEDIDLRLKRMVQSEYEREHTREEFVQLIGRSYL